MNLQSEVNGLIQSQRNDWKEFDKRVQDLSNLQTKTLSWDNSLYVDVQFNPARIVSSAAKVDSKNIEKRPCFLCEANRPSVQRGIPFLEKYIILVNPFPILKNHLTIPLHSHVPQRIGNKMVDLLSLAESLPDYVVFYNGPKSGASAPDHFHFQAGLKSEILMQGENELRSCLIIESENKEEILQRFDDIYDYLKSKQPNEEEPMMNIIAFVEDAKYVVHVFPRKAHRPRQYFLEGNSQLLVSPGAIDMTGLIITSRPEDFEKISRQDIEDIYNQVSMPII